VTAANPFVDRAVVDGLYHDADRLTRRTSALHSAKTSGRPVANVIADVAAAHFRHDPDIVVADIGCGRGTSTRTLADRLPYAHVLGIDASAAMLAAAQARITGPAARRVIWLRADFHDLPIPDGALSFVAAAFCLYHSPLPRDAVADLARCMAPGSVAVLVTKSRDSYRGLDELVAASGLDPGACRRPSLYESAHGRNLAALAATALTVRHVEHEQHDFVFNDLGHLADYLATSPKYVLPPEQCSNPEALAEALRARLADRPITAASTITYVIAYRNGIRR
jgi:ubiquinone/menaquinone biosynthesis C-methylase UbiE